MMRSWKFDVTLKKFVYWSYAGSSIKVSDKKYHFFDSCKKNWMMRSLKFDVAPKKCGSWHAEACGRRPPIWAQQTLGRIIILFLPAPHPASPNSTSFQTSSSSSSSSSSHHYHHHRHSLTCSKQSVVEHISGQTNHGATGFQRIIWPRTNKPRMTNCAPN